MLSTQLTLIKFVVRMLFIAVTVKMFDIAVDVIVATVGGINKILCNHPLGSLVLTTMATVFFVNI